MVRVLRTDGSILPGFTPSEYELSFGAETGRVVELDGFSLSGRIDRIDRGTDGHIAVIDYKSGRVDKYKLSDMRSQIRLQVPLYMIAAETVLGDRAVAGLYRSMTDGAARGAYDPEQCPGDGLTRTDADPDLTGTMAWAPGVASQAAVGMRRGEIAPASGNEFCDYCSAASYCGGGGRS